MSALNFSQSDLYDCATAKSRDRGEDYYQIGAVSTLTQRGNSLQGEVQGNDYDPYRVTISWRDREPPLAACTCPYDFGGWCKHIVAVLLTYWRDPDSIHQGQTLEQLLDRLNDVQTQTLLQNLVAEFPQLLDAIERQVTLLSPAMARTARKAQRSRHSTIDPQPFRRQTRDIIREAIRHWEYGGEDDPLTDGILNLLESVQTLMERGESDNALAVLEAITETCGANWDDAYDLGADSEEIAIALDAAWTEAILSAELPLAQKVDLKVNLEFWQDELQASFATGLEAIACGWDDPQLQQILQGNFAELRERNCSTNQLAPIRLKILSRQQRYPEYLSLAQATGQTQQYLSMLVQLDRVEEAMQAASTQLSAMEPQLN